MIRTLTLAAAIALLGAAVPASAQEIHVKVAGKDAATLHHDIVQAARKVCQAELADSVLAFDLQDSCIRHSVKAAEATLAISQDINAEGSSPGGLTQRARRRTGAKREVHT